MSNPSERIIEIDVEQEMRDSFLEYSYSVIYARALPDARDGLKPVQRRIIYQMGEMGLRSDRGHVKSARVTGEVMGKLHPHGDSAIYDALVRMAQPFSMRIPLIDGHGNFGSLDDGPAAARYTEVKLTQASEFLNVSLDENVVDFVPNYDAQILQPSVLPAAYPNLLVNGASGIAVGMATNIPPHNLLELTKAVELLIDNPNLDLDAILKVLPGPDFPGGGILVDPEVLREIYEFGKGSIRVRARTKIESVAPRKLGIVVTELPYLVGPERVIEKIKDGVNSKKLEGISNVVDLTDRENGLRLVIELKSGVDPESVLASLYRFTPLEDTFAVNAIALVDGRPEQLGLIELLKVFIRHRMQVIERRTKDRLDKRLSRLHLLEGLRVAVLNLDEVIEVIRSSDTSADAKSKLISVFDLSELQSEHILELRLRRLTRFSVLEIEKETSELELEVSELRDMLDSRLKREQLLLSELHEVCTAIGDHRRTEISGSLPAKPTRVTSSVSQLNDEATRVVITHRGKIFRTTESGESKEGASLRTSTRSDVAMILGDGRALRVHVADIPPSDIQGESGASIEEFLGSDSKLGLIATLPWAHEADILLLTKSGSVKRVSGLLPDRKEVSLVRLNEGDLVVGAAYVRDKDNLVIVTSGGYALRTGAQSIRQTGLAAGAIAGIKLNGGAALALGIEQFETNSYLATAANSSASLEGTDPGTFKISEVSDLPLQGRGGQGVRCHKFLKGEDQIYFAVVSTKIPTLGFGAGKTSKLEGTVAKRDASGQRISEYLIALQ